MISVIWIRSLCETSFLPLGMNTERVVTGLQASMGFQSAEGGSHRSEALAETSATCRVPESRTASPRGSDLLVTGNPCQLTRLHPEPNRVPSATSRATLKLN
jgi:hypothetical protein